MNKSPHVLAGVISAILIVIGLSACRARLSPSLEENASMKTTGAAISDQDVVWGWPSGRSETSGHAEQVSQRSVSDIPGPADCDVTAEETELIWAEHKERGGAVFAKFPEVVSIWNRGFTQYSGSQQLCSGTVISPSWILTAAHCFLGDDRSTATITPGEDFRHVVNDSVNIEIRAGAAVTLDERSRRRTPDLIIAHAQYSAEPDYNDDLALVHISEPLPYSAVHSARLGSILDWRAKVTIGGYGYSASGPDMGPTARPSAGRLNIVWPNQVRVGVSEDSGAEGKMSFIPTGDKEFCPGDSGGAVFASRLRGCYWEPQPHILQGVVSYYDKGKRDSTEASQIAHCQMSVQQVMQDITTPAHRAWICRNTNQEANGCK